MRVARVQTGRLGVLGFAGSMHGKSMATAQLGWDNGDGLQLPPIRRLPFVDTVPEAVVLQRLREALAQRDVGLVLVEPLQGSNGGLSASHGFYSELARETRAAGALLAYDEILTGFHRTGSRFVCEAHGVDPNLLLFGKACGNGFPVSGIALRTDIAVQPQMLPGSTYSNNPLAAAVVNACVKTLATLEPEARAANMELAVRERLAWVVNSRLKLRGAGAFWVLCAQDELPVFPLVQALYQAGLCVSHAGRQIRLLPSITMPTSLWQRALDRLSEVLEPVTRA